MNKIIFISGRLCSGKSTIAQTICDQTNSKHIEVSDIVKSILNETDRSKLQGHPELDEQIIEKIDSLLNESSLVISGARQASILKAFPDAVNYWLEVSEQERRDRYRLRASEKDTKLTFEEASQGDIDLGIEEVYSYIEYLKKYHIGEVYSITPPVENII